MNVLVVNAGSSSLKYQLLNTETREVYAKGNCERIGSSNGIFGHQEFGGEKIKEEFCMSNHKTAIARVLEVVSAGDIKIEGIGHRIVQGGWHFPDSCLVDDESMARILEVAPLAPLHNYAEADVINYCRSAYPELPNVAVFDTSFHFDIPEVAQRYALPNDVREKFHVRKYGAHGTSHRYAWKMAHEYSENTHKLLSCHLGNGASLSAIVDGKDMDTTMGLTPLDGLMMGTRCGSIDPATVCYLQREGGFTYQQVDDMMNKKSGLLAVSERTNDSRDIEDGAAAGDEKCQLALDMFCYKCATNMGSMIAAMQGVDTISFSAGIGENSATTRSMVCKNFEWLGVKIDEEKNVVRSGEVRSIAAPDSKIEVLVIPTDEEYMIALDVKRIVSAC